MVQVRDGRHPLVGGLALNEEMMELVQDEGLHTPQEPFVLSTLPDYARATRTTVFPVRDFPVNLRYSA